MNVSFISLFITFFIIVNCTYDEGLKINQIEDNETGIFPFYIDDDKSNTRLLNLLIDKDLLNEAYGQMKLFIDILMNKDQKQQEKTNSHDHKNEAHILNFDHLTFDNNNDNDNETTECSGVGIKMIKHGFFNRCIGKSCVANEIICNNITYTNSTFDQIKDDLTNCIVPSIKCDEEIYNFNNTCTFHKFRCLDGNEYLPKEMSPNRIMECHNQISCEYVKYGYEVFDFKCSTMRLECNGEIVPDNSDYKPVDPNCHIINIPCDNVSPNAVCSDLNITCPEDWTQSVCKNHVNWTTTCPNGYIPLELRSLICKGEEVIYDKNFNRSIHSCESVRSVKFGEKIRYLPDDEGTICRIMDLYCNGTYIPFLFNNIPDSCSVGHIFCFNTDDITEGCTTYNIGCSTNQCHYREREYKCRNKCTQYGLGETCDCPIDYYGSNCEYSRSIQCSFDISKSDILNECENKQFSAIYPSCTKKKRNDIFGIEGKLNCWFPAGSIEELNRSVVTNFDYEVLGDQIVLYKAANWTLMIKVFNFMHYFDLKASPQIRLDIDQMTGKKPIDLKLNISQLDDKWLLGGKIFTELKFKDQECPQSMNNKAMTTVRIELTDYKPKIRKKKRNVGPILAGIFIPLALIGISTIIYIYIRKRKNQNLDYQPLRTSESNER